nr:hypothetical protein [Corynebacterium lactis]
MGKSTLGRALAGRFRPEGGAVTIDVARPSPARSHTWGRPLETPATRHGRCGASSPSRWRLRTERPRGEGCGQGDPGLRRGGPSGRRRSLA